MPEKSLEEILEKLLESQDEMTIDNFSDVKNKIIYQAAQAIEDYYLEKESAEILILKQVRSYLKSGATLKATDVNKPILELLPDGTCDGGLTIIHPGIQKAIEER